MGPLADPSNSSHYQFAMSELQKELRKPGIQRKVFSYTQASPSEIVRARLSTSEIQHRALTYLPDEILKNVPETHHAYSLFDGFQATVPESDTAHRKTHRRHNSRGQTLLGLKEDADESEPPPLAKLKRERNALNHRLEMMSVRKNMCSSEIREIDTKISNLNNMRKIVLDRLEDLEQDELQLEHDISGLDGKIEDLAEEMEDAATLAQTATPPTEADVGTLEAEGEDPDASFMSASIYGKLPSPKSKRGRLSRRKSMPIRHGHFEPGSSIKEIQAHNDKITALDFDAPFGTMVTAALDDTVRVWDLNLGRCIGLLEGHQASVRCLQVEDNIAATGSMDASIRLWDLSRADYTPHETRMDRVDEDDEHDLAFGNAEDEAPPPHPSSMQDCPIFSLEAHVAEVTALHLRGETLISGSADKTLRQWDLVKGRCIQTLDVLWAAAQASVSMPAGDGGFRSASRAHDASADFVGALQSFDAALACGTADGLVRLWDLRSGQVHRNLVGHTGPITCLQFDDTHIVTGSLDRSIRIWDLRTGSIHDAYAYDNPVSSMMFDSRRIVSAVGETVAKVYDKVEARHWDCGPGVNAEAEGLNPATVERVRVRDGYMTEGRKDGTVGVWTC